MLLTLVRHAYAGQPDKDKWPDDDERPLTQTRGVQKFSKAASGLGELVKPTPTHVYSAPAKRTWQTAKLLHSEAGWPIPMADQAMEDGQPAETQLALLKKLQDEKHDSIALVGHGPELDNLLSLLLSGEPNKVKAKLKKGGAICLKVPSGPGSAELQWMMNRKALAKHS
jgi:phosphohistidine phosphatase SixA